MGSLMSSLTPCNYCNMRNLRANTPKTHRLIKRTSTWASGVNIYRVPKDVELPKPIVEDSEFHKEYMVSWFMRLPPSCCC